MRTSPLHQSFPRPRAMALEAPAQGLPLRWLVLPVLLALAVLLAGAGQADAKRLGGNKSFGSRDSYSTNYSKPAPPAQGAATTQQQAAQKPQGAPGQGGFMSKFGGIGGMLGGLLVGGMLGSLLFGGMGGGVGILEIMLLCFAGYMLFRFIRSRRAAQAGGERPAANDGLAYAGAGAPDPAQDVRPDGWGALRQGQAGGGAAAASAPVALPDGIDEEEFLAGAKALYARLQASWDRRDLDDIKGFTSPEVFAEISDQAKNDPQPGRTDVLVVEARVLEAATHGTQTVISVLYDALLREDKAEDRPSQVREIWHIRRDEASPKPQWVLEGIQQLN